ncbi:MAG TPA: SulP family inorganic anion transporter [Sandaracinaceae bacterium LLY-WYZ-13_1]|nr:SulP family inorganic anion transporter [Sandaracinaceae bacterium LLY-WYZ-13_1]
MNHLGHDLRAGALVSVLALPLCLGIAVASGFPASSGILTAVIGGLVVSWLGSARVTIKGPAAGLIVIVLAAVADLGVRGTLAAIVVSGLAQVVLAKAGAAKHVRLVPPAVIHGMLAAIGLVILIKQLPVLLAIPTDGGDVLALLGQTLQRVPDAHPAAAVVGLAALATLGAFVALARKRPELRVVPAPLLAVAVAGALGLALALPATTEAGVALRLELPSEPSAWVLTPDFAALATPLAWYHALMLTAIGSLESLLSARAVDGLTGDRSDLSRDLFAVGVGNVVAGALGGLPMISEVVRSTANVEYGGRTPRANAIHGACLFAMVALVPGLLALVPVPALAALLVAVALKLASPESFRREMNLGIDQMLVFGATVAGALAVDLLAGVALGLVTKVGVHLVNGAPPTSFLGLDAEVEEDRSEVRIVVRGAALFTNAWRLRRLVSRFDARPVTLDLSGAALVDHTAMVQLDALRTERADGPGPLVLAGLDGHRPLSRHPLATRKRVSAPAADAAGDEASERARR